MAKKIKTVITITEDGIEMKTNDPEFTGVFDAHHTMKELLVGGDVSYTLTLRQLRRLDRIVRILERNERREGKG